MITQEFLHKAEANDVLGIKDIDTEKFILSLYKSDDIDISEAYAFLEDKVSINSPIEALALKFIAHNFQYYKQESDTTSDILKFDSLYDKILNHNILGFYALLKEFMPPFTDDWVLKQSITYMPLKNRCEENDLWVSAKENMSLKWETSASMLATLICSKFDNNIALLKKQLNNKLNRENLALFFDLEEIEGLVGDDGCKEVKMKLL